ncbi:hypothetical protein AC480_00270 [miscellaneous Crenarchaeota group archaeon SMTZ1-55]|nr:MAG: hypothetical protein AC480_00270 [miscellaneous Crenarchaeota group archaeon SMTZ1-55]
MGWLRGESVLTFFNVKITCNRKTFKRAGRNTLPMKIRVTVKRPYGDIEVEGESLDEVVQGLEAFPEWLVVIDKLMATTEAAPEEEALQGIIEVSSEGPQLIIPKDRVSSKEAIGLLLYAQDPTPLEPKEVGALLSLSGHGSAGYGSRLSEMRREGSILKEGSGYRLSVAGRKWVEDLAVRLKT